MFRGCECQYSTGMARPLLLVTGISGLLGSNLARVASRNGYAVAGTYQRHRVTIGDARSIALNLEQPDDAAGLVHELQPSAVIHTAAMSRPDDCANDPDRCGMVNIESTRLLARAAADCGARFLFLSSDLVYGNQLGELVEDVPVQPVGVYASSKLAAERAALEETDGSAFIARTSLIYGWGSGGMVCTFEEWLETLRAGQRIRAFTDQRRCPTYAIDLAQALLQAASADLAGVYNVAGPEFCSRYEFACAMADEFGLDKELIEPFSIDDFGYSDPRPRELHLNISKLQAAIGYAPLGVAEALRELHAQQGG